MSSVSRDHAPLKALMAPRDPYLADSDYDSDSNSDSEVFIYITFHKEKTSQVNLTPVSPLHSPTDIDSSRAPDHPRSLNSMVASFLANEPMIPDVLLVDSTMMQGVIAGRMVELLAQARPNSRRPDIERFPLVVDEDEDEEVMDYGELNPNPAILRRRIRQLANRYRSIMIISNRDPTTEVADMRGWNIGEGLYERIRFLEDHETVEMVLNGKTTISENCGPDVLVKY